jgi:hypothetical protein
MKSPATAFLWKSSSSSSYVPPSKRLHEEEEGDEQEGDEEEDDEDGGDGDSSEIWIEAQSHKNVPEPKRSAGLNFFF